MQMPFFVVEDQVPSEQADLGQASRVPAQPQFYTDSSRSTIVP